MTKKKKGKRVIGWYLQTACHVYFHEWMFHYSRAQHGWKTHQRCKRIWCDRLFPLVKKGRGACSIVVIKSRRSTAFSHLLLGEPSGPKGCCCADSELFVSPQVVVVSLKQTHSRYLFVLVIQQAGFNTLREETHRCFECSYCCGHNTSKKLCDVIHTCFLFRWQRFF